MAFVLDARVAGCAAQWKHPSLDILVGLLNPIGSGVTLLAACLALAVCGRMCGWSRLEGAARLGALGFVAAGLLEFTVKHLVSRPRPDAGLWSLGFHGPAFLPDVDSFPSGHATSVFTVATAFASFYPGLGPVLYGVAVAVAVGRVYLLRHYVSDVVAGAVIGIVMASVLLRYVRARSQPTPQEPSTAPSR